MSTPTFIHGQTVTCKGKSGNFMFHGHPRDADGEFDTANALITAEDGPNEQQSVSMSDLNSETPMPQVESPKAKLGVFKAAVAAFLCSALIASCTIFQNHELAQGFYAGVVSTALQYLVPKPMVPEVAQDFIVAGQLYGEATSDNNLPTPEKFDALLVKYLPNNSSKEMARGTIMTIYWTYSPIWAKYTPTKATAALQDFLIGGARGAAPYAPKS